MRLSCIQMVHFHEGLGLDRDCQCAVLGFLDARGRKLSRWHLSPHQQRQDARTLFEDKPVLPPTLWVWAQNANGPQADRMRSRSFGRERGWLRRRKLIRRGSRKHDLESRRCRDAHRAQLSTVFQFSWLRVRSGTPSIFFFSLIVQSLLEIVSYSKLIRTFFRLLAVLWRSAWRSAHRGFLGLLSREN